MNIVPAGGRSRPLRGHCWKLAPMFGGASPASARERELIHQANAAHLVAMLTPSEHRVWASRSGSWRQGDLRPVETQKRPDRSPGARQGASLATVPPSPLRDSCRSPAPRPWRCRSACTTRIGDGPMTAYGSARSKGPATPRQHRSGGRRVVHREPGARRPHHPSSRSEICMT